MPWRRRRRGPRAVQQPPGHGHLVLPRSRAFDALREQLTDVPRSAGRVRRSCASGVRVRDRRGGLLDRHAGQRDPRAARRISSVGSRSSGQTSTTRASRSPAAPCIRAAVSRTSPRPLRERTPRRPARASRSSSAFVSAPCSPGTTWAAIRPSHGWTRVVPQHIDLLPGRPPGARLGVFGFALREGGMLFLGARRTSIVAVRLPRHRRRSPDLHADQRGGPTYTQSRAVRTERTVRSDHLGVRSVRAPGVAGQRAAASSRAAGGRPSPRRQGVPGPRRRAPTVEVVGDVGPYCRVAEGRMTGAVVSFLRPELQEEARALLLLCRADPRARHRPVHPTVRSRPCGSSRRGGSGRRLIVHDPGVRTRARSCRPSLTGPRAGFRPGLGRLEHELLVSQDTLRRHSSSSRP